MKRFAKAVTGILALSMLLASASGCSSTDTKYSAYNSTGERYDYYLPDYVEVCDYTGIELPDLTFTPTKEDVDNYVMYMESLMCSFTHNPDRPCRRGDIVDIITTCKFTDTGKPYGYFYFTENDIGYGQSFTLGANYFGFPALDEVVEGMSVGETKTVTLNLPDPFYKDYMNSGREIEIEIYLNYIDEINYEDATDEKYLSFCEYTKENFRLVAESKITTDKNGMIENYKSDLAWRYIYENSKLKKVPEKEYEEFYNAALNKTRSEAQEEEMTLLEYVQSIGYEDLDEYYDFLKEFAEDCCYEDMLIYYIIRCENLNYDDNYYDDALLEKVKDYQITDVGDAEEFLDYYYGIESVREDIRFSYAKDWIADQANVREDITTINSKELNK